MLHQSKPSNVSCGEEINRNVLYQSNNLTKVPRFPTSAWSKPTQKLYTELPGRHFPINVGFKELRLPLCYDALIIPGGRFSELLSTHDEAIAIVSSFASLGRPIMATCHSALFLVSSGCLTGIKCTAFPSLKPVVELAGGTWVDPYPISSAMVDRNVVSAIGWPAHAELLRLLLRCMGAKVTAASQDPPPSVLFLCGDYVDDLELNVPYRAFGAFGSRVEAVCPTKKKGEHCITAIYDDEGAQVCCEKRGHNFSMTADWVDVRATDYDCVVIPGGRSPELLVGETVAVEMVKEFAEIGKVVAAIGDGQLLLATALLLKGKRCATEGSLKKVVELGGGDVVEAAKSMADGKVVTATGPEAMPQFISDLMSLMAICVTF